MIHISVNDNPMTCKAGSTISELLAIQEISPNNIAIAVNEVVIPKAQWDETRLEEGAQILIIKAVQGG